MDSRDPYESTVYMEKLHVKDKRVHCQLIYMESNVVNCNMAAV